MGASGQGDQLVQGGQISPLFHEGAQDIQLINLAILPRWVGGFQAAEAKLVSRRVVLEAVIWGDGAGWRTKFAGGKCALSALCAISPLLMCWIAGRLPIGTVLFCRCGDERDILCLRGACWRMSRMSSDGRVLWLGMASGWCFSGCQNCFIKRTHWAHPVWTR
jgi:hypothetical protein